MNCKKCSELMSLYIDNQLDNNEAILIEEHFESCKECFEKYKELKNILNSLNELEEELPHNFHQGLMKKINQIDSPQVNENIFKNIFSFKYFTPIAALVCFVFIIYSNNINDISPDLNNKVEEQHIESESPKIAYFNDEIDSNINSIKDTRGIPKPQMDSIPEKKSVQNLMVSEQSMGPNEERNNIFNQIIMEFKNKYKLDKELLIINLDNINKEDQEWLKKVIGKYDSNIKFEDDFIKDENSEVVTLKIKSIEYNDIVKIELEVNLKDVLHNSQIELVNTDIGYNILIRDKVYENK